MVPALSLIVTIVALLPSTVDRLVDALADKSPRYSVLTFFVDNVANLDGEVDADADFSIGVQVTNLNNAALIIDDSLWCYTREGIVFEEATVQSDNPELAGTRVAYSARFNLYLENLEKTVVPAFSTATVQWEVTEEQYLELNAYSAGQLGSQFARNGLPDFYAAVLQVFEPVRSGVSEENFPRGAYFAGETLASFFLNFDCDFEVENAFGVAVEELHLEFVYESTGQEGVFPRWKIGKNVGDGGGGFGNGSG